MRAIRVHQTGGPEVLRLEDVDAPRPASGTAVVRVEYAGVNFVDTYKRAGIYPVPRPFILGEEGAGVVESVGDGVLDVKPGDRVAWAGVMGAYATQAIIPAARLLHLPKGVDTRLAAAVMLQGMTAHYLASSTFPLKHGDTCLVHAAAGGTGLLLVQIAKLRGARVIGTVGNDDKAALAMENGTDDVVIYTRQNFVEEVKRLTSGRGVDVVYDSVGKTTFLAGLDVIRPRGMMVLFGAASGPVAPFDPQLLNQKGSLYLTRSTMNQYVAGREELVTRATELFTWIGRGDLKVRVGREFALAEAADAHRALEGRQTTGKVLLRI
jgi:NADPH2:quinone reductase